MTALLREPVGAGSLVTRLEVELRPARALVVQELALLWDRPDVRRAYTAYLVTMHAVVRSTVPLMELALACVRRRRSAAVPDAETPAPTLRMLEDYLSRHVREETGHDAWVLEDLAAAGADPRIALDRVPTPAVASLVGAQYYWVAHAHPAALLGHIAIMEGSPPTEAVVARLRRATGLGESAFRSLARHAVLDRRHRRELGELLGRLSLPPRLEGLVGLSALHTATGVADVLHELRCGLEREPA